MKLAASILFTVVVMSGCVAGSTIPHDDSPAATKRSEGPALCRDGTAPPCNDRD